MRCLSVLLGLLCSLQTLVAVPLARVAHIASHSVAHIHAQTQAHDHQQVAAMAMRVSLQGQLRQLETDLTDNLKTFHSSFITLSHSSTSFSTQEQEEQMEDMIEVVDYLSQAPTSSSTQEPEEEKTGQMKALHSSLVTRRELELKKIMEEYDTGDKALQTQLAGSSTQEQEEEKTGETSNVVDSVFRLSQVKRSQAKVGEQGKQGVDSPVFQAPPRMQMVASPCGGFQCGPGDVEAQNLILALQQIKNDIVDKSHALLDDSHWVDQVKVVLGDYEVKLRNVVSHMANLQSSVKNLYKKKRQVENLVLQKKLSEKLMDAKGDLSSVSDAYHAAESKKNAFIRSKGSVLGSISSIQAQLTALRTPGAPPPNGDPKVDPRRNLPKALDIAKREGLPKALDDAKSAQPLIKKLIN